jgi:hypothetical protein
MNALVKFAILIALAGAFGSTLGETLLHAFGM